MSEKDFETLKLAVDNFQIIKHAEVEFNPTTLTLISGESGNGKSSLFRAIKILLLNPSGTQNKIRHGASSFKIRMQYRGNDIELERTKKDSTYTINGEVYSKCGQTNVFKLLETECGFVLDDKNNILNIEGNKEVLFPYGLTGSELFKLYENVFSVSDSVKIFQLYKQEEDFLNKELQENTNNLNKSKLKIKVIEDLQSKVDVVDLKRRRDNLQDLDSRYSKLSKDLVDIDFAVKCEKVLRENNIKVKVFTVETINDYIKLYRDLVSIKKAIKAVNSLRNIDTSAKVFDTDKVTNYIKLRNDLKIIEVAKNLPEVKDEKQKVFTEEKINKYLKLRKDYAIIDKVKNLPKVDEIERKVFTLDKLTKYVKMRDDLEKLKVIISEIKQGKKEAVELEERAKSLKERVKTCPTCGSVCVGDC